jgi:hypothetical protein
MRAIPDTNSGASRPLSAAWTANFRTAVMRTLIEIGPSPRASRATRQAVTVAFVNPAGRGSSANQAMNSSSPRLYTLLVIGDGLRNNHHQIEGDQTPRILLSSEGIFLGLPRLIRERPTKLLRSGQFACLFCPERCLEQTRHH